MTRVSTHTVAYRGTKMGNVVINVPQVPLKVTKVEAEMSGLIQKI